MALEDEVKSRYSVRFLTNITNPDKIGTSAIDETRLTKASDDAESQFKREAQQTFDITDQDHISAIVPLVVFLLQERADQLEEGAADRLTKIMEDIVFLKKFTVRAAQTPRTTVKNQPTREVPLGQTVVPEFDTSKFTDQFPESP